MLLCEGMALFDSPPGHTLLDYVIIHVLTFYSSVLKKILTVLSPNLLLNSFLKQSGDIKHSAVALCSSLKTTLSSSNVVVDSCRAAVGLLLC